VTYFPPGRASRVEGPLAVGYGVGRTGRAHAAADRASRHQAKLLFQSMTALPSNSFANSFEVGSQVRRQSLPSPQPYLPIIARHHNETQRSSQPNNPPLSPTQSIARGAGCARLT
jgi:hypothetical protein